MMKKFIYIFLTIFVGFATFVACDKKEDDKTPDTNAAQKECENKNHPDSTYTWVDNKCVATFTGTIKHDTTILCNAPGITNPPTDTIISQFPTVEEMKTILANPLVKNVNIGFYQTRQFAGPGNILKVIVLFEAYDSLGKGRVKFLPIEILVAFDPNLEQIADFITSNNIIKRLEKFGYTLKKDDSKSAGNNGQTAQNFNRKYGEKLALNLKKDCDVLYKKMVGNKELIVYNKQSRVNKKVA